MGMAVGNRVVTLGSGCVRWIPKVQKGLLPPSSDTLHSPGNPDNHSITIHTTENLTSYVIQMNWRIKMRRCSNVLNSIIWLSKCFVKIYIYAHTSSFVFNFFCSLLSTRLLPSISVPATQSISAIEQASSWYIYCCKMVLVFLSWPAWQCQWESIILVKFAVDRHISMK